jgi:hypothetical protein
LAGPKGQQGAWVVWLFLAVFPRDEAYAVYAKVVSSRINAFELKAAVVVGNHGIATGTVIGAPQIHSGFPEGLTVSELYHHTSDSALVFLVGGFGFGSLRQRWHRKRENQEGGDECFHQCATSPGFCTGSLRQET